MCDHAVNVNIIHSEDTILSLCQCLQCLFNGDHLQVHLRQKHIQHNLGKCRGLVGRQFHYIVPDHVDVVVQIEQSINGAHDNTGKSYPGL